MRSLVPTPTHVGKSIKTSLTHHRPRTPAPADEIEAPNEFPTIDTPFPTRRRQGRCPFRLEILYFDKFYGVFFFRISRAFGAPRWRAFSPFRLDSGSRRLSNVEYLDALTYYPSGAPPSIFFPWRASSTTPLVILKLPEERKL